MSTSLTDALISERYLKSEPVKIDWKTEEESKWLFIDAYNWYSASHTIDDGRKWLLKFLVQERYSSDLIEKIKSVPKWRISCTVCWIARIALNGNKIPESTMNFFKRSIHETAAMASSVRSVDGPKLSNVQKHIQRIVNDHIGEIEDLIDMVIRDKKIKIDIISFLKEKSIPKKIADEIVIHYQKLLKELKSGDNQIIEAYGSELPFWQKFYTGVISDIETFATTAPSLAKTPRKPRRKKVIPPSQLVKKVQYKLKDPSLKIESIPPVKIIGASTVWTFNTRYKTLMVYNASGPGGLSVKGTTIQNFDEKTSLQKIVRKPKDVLKIVAAGGKVALRKIMPSLNTKAAVPSGRLNKETLIVTVF